MPHRSLQICRASVLPPVSLSVCFCLLLLVVVVDILGCGVVGVLSSLFIYFLCVSVLIVAVSNQNTKNRLAECVS